MIRRLLVGAAFCSLFLVPSLHAAVLSFEDLSLGGGLDGSTQYGSSGTYFWNGSNEAGGFSTGGANFGNSYFDHGGGFYSWEGFAYSNTTDSSTPGFGNQYSAFPGGGAGGSANYVVGYQPYLEEWALNFDLAQDFTGLSVDITNTTYTALTILNGDGFTDAFADGDWFLLTITGWNGAASTGAIEFYLADYRDGATDLVDEWTSVNLSALGSDVDKITFALTSSDTNTEFGFMNTPAYFAMDNLGVSAVPEPSTYVLVGLGLMTLVWVARRKETRS